MDQDPQGVVPIIDGFQVVEREYSDDPDGFSVGLANIHAAVPGIEENKAKIERAARIFGELGVNVAIFPEFALSGYFWDDEPACRAYMDQALTENHLDWIAQVLLPLCTGELKAIIINNLTAAPTGRYRNRTIIVSPVVEDPLDPVHSYDKIFLPGIEKVFTDSGTDERLVIDAAGGTGRFGFTTCYDYLFTELLRRYAFDDHVDAIVQIASWRAASSREYPRMNVRTELYYGELWDSVLGAASAQNQLWTIACNAVGRHGITGEAFWGGSGIWAPSGIKLVQASHFNEELLVVRNLDIQGGRQFELDDFNYEFDFRQVYRPMAAGPAVTESIE
ncbi:MAG TPA: carbon-nitrogen hydrolase family protein [Acidimicrobiia bacterium]|nr:carbon-nitrogen hydrolase family protein [Acidimicrobiia bacterium]